MFIRDRRTSEHDNSKIDQIELILPPRMKWSCFWTPKVFSVLPGGRKTGPVSVMCRFRDPAGDPAI